MTDYFSALQTDFLTPIREKIYQQVAMQFQIQTALYPGAGHDIIPSLSIPYVLYIENAPMYAGFYGDRKRISSWLEARKSYSEPCIFEYDGTDYHSTRLADRQFDLLISQYAGPVGQVMKPHLKSGGILLTAEGPEDADLAMRDPDYVLIGTINFAEQRADILSGYHEAATFTIDDGAGGKFAIPIARSFCFRKLK